MKTTTSSKTLSTAPKRIILWDQREFKEQGVEYVPVWIDVQRLEAMLPFASMMEHVRYAGENGIWDKYTGVDEFIRSPKFERLEMPPARIERACEAHPELDIVYLFNGRHRFAWMRDHGAVALPVAVARGEAEEVAEMVGTTARECVVTMQHITEWSVRWRAEAKLEEKINKLMGRA